MLQPPRGYLMLAWLGLVSNLLLLPAMLAVSLWYPTWRTVHIAVGAGAVLPERNAGGRFGLYRIGDAVAARNIHAAIYEALRIGLRW